MEDYLKIYEKFKDIKEIKDYIDEVNELRYYYDSQQFDKMHEHIKKLITKYHDEADAWNSVNPCKPTTHQQSYINAENFLQAQGAKLFFTKATDFKQQLLN
ncbi:MAG: hypothetical protein K2N58_11525 [Treponemataceae bacterium]|nr:hypothetical protein [Treponemataceae bacterium]